ncbi:hypothetical protein V7O67_05335 [Methanolobus sp. ZRKC4]|uniref:hypothetical protein n=1 Tax=Methanolobus sp. ZRKC4 TaxID=3125787 RepID=UPI00324CC354
MSSSTLPFVLSSDDAFNATLSEINLKIENNKAFFSILQARLEATLSNETADPSLTPTRTIHTIGSALLPPLITREEIEEFKKQELAKLGLDYIPQVLAEFQEGE